AFPNWPPLPAARAPRRAPIRSGDTSAARDRRTRTLGPSDPHLRPLAPSPLCPLSTPSGGLALFSCAPRSPERNILQRSRRFASTSSQGTFFKRTCHSVSRPSPTNRGG